jgi:hypothetical protein
MAVRTFVTSGVAFVAAGAVAATVALAPPMSPRDIQVAKSTEVSLNALVTDPALQQLINTYFNSGAAAVVQQLLIAVVGPDGTASDVINDFFDGGTTQLAYRILGGDFDGDPSTTPFLSTFFNINNPLEADTENPGLFGASGVTLQALRNAAAAGLIPAPVIGLLNAFFEGGTSTVAQALLLAVAPGQAQLINDFFSGGVSKVVQTGLDNATSGRPQQLINDFFDGGTPQVGYDLLGGDLGTPDPAAPPTAPADLPTSTPYLSAFFGINNNVLDPDDTGAGGLSGVSGVVLQRLLDATQGDATAQSLLRGFFGIGISEVIRQILTEPPTPVAEDATTTSADRFVNTLSLASSTTSVGTDPTSVDPKPTLKLAGPQLKLAGTEVKTAGTELKTAGTELKDLTPTDPDPAPVITKVKTDPVQAQPVSAPVAPVVASPPSPPAQNSGPAAPATGKDKDPVAAKPASKDDPKDAKDPKGTDDNDVTDAMKNGNKVEVDPLLLLGPNGRGPKAGEGSWGVFGQVADAIGKAVAGAVGPASAPAKTEGAGAGAAGSAGSAGGS